MQNKSKKICLVIGLCLNIVIFNLSHANTAANKMEFPYSQFGLVSPFPITMEDLILEYLKICNAFDELTYSNCDFILSYSEIKEIEIWFKEQVKYSSDTNFSESILADIKIDKNWDEFYLKTIMWSYSLSFPTNDYLRSKSVVEKILKWIFLKKKISTILNYENNNTSSKIFDYLNPTSKNLELSLLRSRLDSNFLLNQIRLFSFRYMKCVDNEKCTEGLEKFKFNTCRIASAFKDRAKAILAFYEDKNNYTEHRKNQIYEALMLKEDIDQDLDKSTFNYFNSHQDYSSNNEDLSKKIINMAIVESTDETILLEAKNLDQVFQIIDVAEFCESVNHQDLKASTILSGDTKVDAYFLNIESELKENLKYFEKKFNLVLQEM